MLDQMKKVIFISTALLMALIISIFVYNNLTSFNKGSVTSKSRNGSMKLDIAFRNSAFYPFVNDVVVKIDYENGSERGSIISIVNNENMNGFNDNYSSISSDDGTCVKYKNIYIFKMLY
jgi:hypothetical protein